MKSRVILVVLASVIGADASLCITDNQPMMEACVPACVESDQPKCMDECLTGRGVSQVCAAELSTGFSCAVAECPTACADARSSECSECLRAKCMPEGSEQKVLAAVVFPVELESEDKSGCYENQAALKKCGTQCFSRPNKAQCATACLKPSMSSGCARCFGQKVDCTIRKCLSQCSANSQSFACKSCVRSKCGRCAMEKSAEDDTFFEAVASFTAGVEENATMPVEQPEAVAEAKSGCYENQAALKKCGTQCFSRPNKAQCATACLKPSMSSGCARCFGQKVDCTIRKCLSQCSANSQSFACKSCVRSKCGRCAMEKSAEDDTFFEAVASFTAGVEENANMPVEEPEAVAEAKSGCYEDQAALKKCGTQCFSRPNKAQCATACLKPSMSSGCARCFGQKVDCTIRKCLSQCSANSQSFACKSCVRSKCGRCAMEKSAEDDTFFEAVASFTAGVEENATMPVEEPEAVAEAKSACYENQAALKKCGTQCFSRPNKAQCATVCLKPSMSSGCARCFGQKVDCTIRKCLSQCSANSQSFACKSCVRSKCGRCAMEKSAEDDTFFEAVVSFAAGAEESPVYP